MPQFAVDLHVHTSAGSLDSYLKPVDLGMAARAREIGGVLVSEHSSQWTGARAAELSAEQGVTIFAGREWNSPFGHMIILGLQPGSPWERRNVLVRSVTGEEQPGAAPQRGTVQEMRRILDDCGGYMILAHPFRYFGGPDNLLFGDQPGAPNFDPATLARHPVFEFVDEVEVANGGCTARENELAHQVAKALGRPGVAGSDAHSRYELGRCSTLFDKQPANVAELIAELRAGRYAPNLKHWARSQAVHPG